MLLITLSLINLAAGAEVSIAPGDSIQAAMNEAEPGDVISIAAGTYEEDLSTEQDGAESMPITLRREGDGEVIITAPGEVLQVDHAHWVFDGLIFDGQYGSADTLDVNDDAHSLLIQNVEVRRSGRDCIDMGAPSGVHILDSTVHHCLHYDTEDEQRVDAHGITGGSVTDLIIESTDIHTFSGDAVQFDPGREAPGWNNIHIKNSRFWLEPLEEAANGFEAGQVPGENAVDTKTVADGERAEMTIEDSEFWGFRNGIDFSNQAALLFKENVNVTVRRTQIYDSEIALRLRGPSETQPAGALVRIESSVIHSVDVGVRYEDNIEGLKLYHLTFGQDIDEPILQVTAPDSTIDARNNLFFDGTLPAIVDPAAGNLVVSAGDFVSAEDHDYHLTFSSPAIDAGDTIEGVDTDADGEARVVGDAPDLGAYEFGHAEDTGLEDTGAGTDDTGTEDTGIESPDDSPDVTDDTGTNTSDSPPSGVGAAGITGEQGGCGCTYSGDAKNRPILLFVMACFVLLKRRKRTA